MIENEHNIQFFTSTIRKWRLLLKPDKYKQIITESLAYLVKDGRVLVFGFVIMPNHLHLIWQIQIGHKREDVQRDFQKFTSQKIKYDLVENHPDVLELFKVENKDRAYQFWERNALSIEIMSNKMLIEKLNYIHDNPVSGRWMLAGSPIEYKWSSANFYETGISDFNFMTHYQDVTQ